MKKLTRTLIIGFIWGFILFGWYLKNFFQENWNLNIFSLGHWLHVVDEFRAGWAIKTTGDWIFVFTSLLMIPFYFWSLKFIINVKWLDLLHKFVNKTIYFLTGSNPVQKKQFKIDINKKSSKMNRPKALDSSITRPIAKESELKIPADEANESIQKSTFEPSSNVGFSGHNTSDMFGMKPNSFDTPKSDFSFSSMDRMPAFTPPSDSPFNSPYSAPSMKQGMSFATPPIDDDFDKILLEDIKIPDREPLEEDIEELIHSAGYDLVKDVKIGSSNIDYLGIGENRILICQIDPKEGDWLADEERFNGEDPLWFSESSHRISPVFRLLENVQEFAKHLSSVGYNGSVFPVFIEKEGTIINAEDMLSTWKELAINVCRTDKGGPDELKSFAETILPTTPPSNSTKTLIQSVL